MFPTFLLQKILLSSHRPYTTSNSPPERLKTLKTGLNILTHRQSEYKYKIPPSGKCTLSSTAKQVLVPRSAEETHSMFKQNMEDDKTSLIKRLDIILAQLETAKTEKEKIENQLSDHVDKV